MLIQLWVVFDSSCFEFLLHLLLVCFPVCYPFAVSVLCRQYSVISLYVVCVVSHVVFMFGWRPCIFDSSSRVSGSTCRSNGSTSSSVKLAHLQAELQAAERLAHMQEKEKNSPRNEKRLIAMQLVEHGDIANRERSLSRSSGSTASGVIVRAESFAHHDGVQSFQQRIQPDSSWY